MDLFAVGGTLNRKIRFLTPRSETGSMTGWGVTSSIHSVSTIQSSQTAEIVLDWKQGVSAGIFAGIVPLFWALETPAVFQADFQPPVSAAENSVPGGRVSRAKTGLAARIIENVWVKAPSRTRTVLLRIKSEGFELPAPFRGSIA
jgi:hypothetical protein